MERYAKGEQVRRGFRSGTGESPGELHCAVPLTYSVLSIPSLSRLKETAGLKVHTVTSC